MRSIFSQIKGFNYHRLLFYLHCLIITCWRKLFKFDSSDVVEIFYVPISFVYALQLSSSLRVLHKMVQILAYILYRKCSFIFYKVFLQRLPLPLLLLLIMSRSTIITSPKGGGGGNKIIKVYI